MKLLLDLGNTRLKAALLAPRGVLRHLGEAPHRDAGLMASLHALLDGVEPDSVDRTLCANVAGEAAARTLAEWLAARGCPRLEFLRAQASAFGVRCGYPEPSRLGADRWAALLGAHAHGDGAYLVVDAGSALTLDALAPGGRHLGGWILPGLNMMVAALESGTGELAALRAASITGPAGPFPVDTGPAMEDGARLAAAGAVRLARERLEAHCGLTSRVLLGGGDAPLLASLVDRAEVVQDLVIQGLARAAEGPV